MTPARHGQHSPAGELPSGFHPSQYADPLMHAERGMALYARYMRPGDLVFDIGANIGQRAGWFMELGARVVAVEPQPSQAEHIPSGATVVVAAVGAEPGSAPFYVAGQTPYMSTLTAAHVDNVQAQPGFGGKAFEATTVEVVTLDGLIAEYGEPVFCKIDVEGGEEDVLAGLSRPLTALSFEVHSWDVGKGARCVERLEELARYTYRYSRLESFELEPWPLPEGVAAAMFGDVYAVRRAT